MSTVKSRTGITDRHALIALLVFFGVVFVANGLLLYWALATHAGIETRDAYRKGLAYNARIAAEARQNKLGWSDVVEARAGQRAITIRLTSGSGAPVVGHAVTARLGRPVTDAYDAVLAVTEISPGLYSARAKAPLAEGNWVLEFEVREKRGAPGDVVYRGKRRLWVRR